MFSFLLLFYASAAVDKKDLKVLKPRKISVGMQVIEDGYSDRQQAWRGGEGDVIWPIEGSKSLPLDVTIVATFDGHEAPLIASWLSNIAAQRATTFYAVELVVLCYGAGAYRTMVDAISMRLA